MSGVITVVEKKPEKFSITIDALEAVNPRSNERAFCLQLVSKMCTFRDVFHTFFMTNCAN